MPKTLPCLQCPLIYSPSPHPTPPHASSNLLLSPFQWNIHYCYTVASHSASCQRQYLVILLHFLLLDSQRQAAWLARCYGLCSLKESTPVPAALLILLHCRLLFALSLCW